MALSNEQKGKIYAEQLKEQARLQAEVNSGLNSYLKMLEKVNDLKESINVAEKNIAKVEAEINSLAGSTLQSDIDRSEELRAAKKELDKQVFALKEQQKLMQNVVKEAKTFKMLTASAVVGTAKMLGNLSKVPGKIGDITNKFKDLFEMDKSIRKAGLEMGLIGKQSEGFRTNIKLAAEDTQKLGVGIKELAEMQAQYSENIGRNVSLGKEGLVALSQISEGTSLGAEATSQMAADFEAQGVSAIRVKDAIEESANRASSMGLNSAKVVKNIAQNTKMLNKFRFKDGIKGLVKMSELSAKLGVDMDFASGFAEKLWNVEGAVETAAQFNVMGGAFARLGDPFKLMYMARNDIAGLTEEIAKASSESATFNKETGKFELGAMEMHRLKIIAEQTGLEYDKLVTAGQNFAKFSKIKTQISFSMNDEAKKFLENTAELDENGKAYITVKGEKKFLSQLGASGAKLIQEQVDEKKSLEERAKAAKSFDEQISNLINMVKTYMLPIVEGITEVLKPFAEDLMGEKGTKFKAELKAIGVTLGEWAKTAAKWFKTLGEVAVALGPTGLLAAWATGKGLMMLFDVAKWVLNGVALSKGFLAGGGGFGRAFASVAGPMLGVALTSIIAGWGGKSLGEKATKAAGRKSTKAGDMWGNIGAGSAALAGAAIGSAFGGVGAIPGYLIGAGIGALAGGFGGKYLGDKYNQDEQTPVMGVNDGIVKFNKNDKFTKVDDSTMIAGTNKNGNKDLAKVLKYGMLASTPLGLPLLASGMIGGGSSNSSNSNGGSAKIEFGDLNITGEIKVSLPGGTQIGAELIKSSEFKSSITRVVQSQLEKNINGKNSDRK
jgi:hypothetical protein